MIEIFPWLGFGIVYFFVKNIPLSHTFLFALNIWLLSIPHTLSTMTRSDLRKPHAMLRTLGILLFFVTGIFILSQYLNFALIFTGYFFWQQFHYARQNLGISRWEASSKKIQFVDHVFYLLIPFISILGLFSKGPLVFFQYLIINPFPFVLHISNALTINGVVTVAYLFFRPKSWKATIQHALLFSIAYLGIGDFYLGWLCLNVFHNLQYLDFMYRFEKKIQFLLWPAIFTLLIFGLESKALMILSLMLALNFTHYTLDSMIWKRAILRDG